jgi:hypothetical protein
MKEDEGTGGYTRKIIEERSKIRVNLWDCTAVVFGICTLND